MGLKLGVPDWICGVFIESVFMFRVIKFDLRHFLRLLVGFILGYGKFIVFENKSGLKRKFCSFRCLVVWLELEVWGCVAVCVPVYIRACTYECEAFGGGSF